MGSKITEIAGKIRGRLGERVLAGVPQWLAPVLPCARHNAGALLIGAITGKLPAEDVPALVQAVLVEQNPDGSWSEAQSEKGDLSLTLEVVEALSASGESSARQALSKSVAWLENHHDHVRLREDTLILLGALTDMMPRRMNRLMMPVLRMFLLSRARRRLGSAPGSVLPIALAILSQERSRAAGRASSLLELQFPDGSWAGTARDTVLALVALRHASLSADDPAFERGWRFLRGLQVWNGENLVQNPCDVSNFLHAVAARTLLVSGSDAEIAAAGSLSLLHQARMSGGWPLGSSLPTDLFTTATVLDALSFAGDIPIETQWARRRAVMLLLRAQHHDGGWPLYAQASRSLGGLLNYRGGTPRDVSRVDVTAAVLQALTYSGVRERSQEDAVQRGLRFLLRREGGGLWPGDVLGSRVFATARSLEALLSVGGESATAAASRAVAALLRHQNSDGGWSEAPGGHSSVVRTSWALRALAGVPAVAGDVLQHGRVFLEQNLDPSELIWTAAAPDLPLPPGLGKGSISDLTTLWALEALAPVGLPSRTRVNDARRSRSLFHRNS